MVPNTDLFWLVGLIEGEGTFDGGPPADRPPAIAVVMTDRDVIDRVARLWDRGTIRQRPRLSQYKDPFATRIRGARAAEWMRLLYPLLGERRQARIVRALAGFEGRPRWRRPDPNCALPDCPRAGAVRGLCRHHYKLWWKAARRGRRPGYAPLDPPPLVAPYGVLTGPALADELWLAGLLEGEGTFVNTGGYPVIKVTMCDGDVLERAAAVMGVAKVWRKDADRSARHGWSPAFETGVTGARAAELMRAVRPLMGERRRGQIDAALDRYHPIRLTAPPKRCVVPACDAPHRSRGLCHRHYMSWARDRKRGRTARVTPLR